MNLRPIKISLVTIVGSIFMMTAIQAYADTTGVDLFALAQSKVNSIIGIEFTQTATNLDNERESVEKQIYEYIDSYIQGIQSELDDYTVQQESIAKESLKENYNNIKNELDNQRQGLITNAKQQIRDNISSELQKQKNKMNDNLINGLAKKFE